MIGSPRRLLLVVVLGACGCARACGSDHVAEIQAIAEHVDRDRAAAVGRWEVAQVGARLSMGDGLRTGVGSQAELELQPSGRLLVQQSTTLRFERKAPGEARGIELQTGALEIESATEPVVLITASGVARIERGARLRVRGDRRVTRLDVALGKVRLERDGQSREIGAGEQYELVVGRPLLEPAPPEPAPRAAPSAPADAGAPAAPPALEVAPSASGPLRFEASPEFVELTLAAGESATIHDPGPPTRVEIAGATCSGELAVETTRGAWQSVEHRVRGHAGAALELPAGRHRYRVRCFEQGRLSDRLAAQGNLIVVRDPGERRLPERAPTASVDADGRRYTVHYQNMLPLLTLRWPNAPAAARYTLELRPERAAPRLRMLAAPSVTLPSGELGEGTHAFRFLAASARSPEGSLRIAFDNAARIAYLSEPRERSFVAGSPVRVRGAALARATVELGGTLVPTDPQGRFDTRTSVGAGARALALRVHYAGSGVHYFLRRVASVVR